MTTLKEQYNTEIKDALQKEFNYPNRMMIPGLSKIIINMGIAEITKDKNAIKDCEAELAAITGQKPIITNAKKSISNFKLREGQPVGMKVTLRGQRMYDFIYRFVHVVCPSIRDFRGLKRSFDSRGNYSLGLPGQEIFPEINLDNMKRTQGMNITFVTTAQTDAECEKLLELVGIPFEKQKVS